MNNPKMSNLIDKLNRASINEGTVKDKKILRDIVDELEKKLSKERIFIEDMGLDGNEIMVTVSGDWKHDHLHLKQYVTDFLSNKGYKVKHSERVIADDDGDTYEADHFFEIMESTVSEETIIESANSPVIDRIHNYLSDTSLERLRIMLSKFSDIPLEDMDFVKSEYPTIDLIDSRLMVFFLREGLSTDEDNNLGVVAVIASYYDGTYRVIHLLDTEILDNGYYKNTMLYNESELYALSDEVYVHMGDVQVK